VLAWSSISTVLNLLRSGLRVGNVDAVLMGRSLSCLSGSHLLVYFIICYKWVVKSLVGQIVVLQLLSKCLYLNQRKRVNDIY
jgi:hypothetical protein